MDGQKFEFLNVTRGMLHAHIKVQDPDPPRSCTAALWIDAMDALATHPRPGTGAAQVISAVVRHSLAASIPHIQAIMSAIAALVGGTCEMHGQSH